jgi:predicted GIY-YIG superfamily endonuclease
MKYENSKIYRLICDDGHYYYGSTTTDLKRRLACHKCKSRTDHSKVYNHINSIGWTRVKIELVEQYSCTSKQELCKKEDWYICKSNSDKLCLNVKRSYVTPEERKASIANYRNSSRDHINSMAKKYRDENKDAVKNSCKSWYENNKQVQKIKFKEYYEKNKEKLSERKKVNYLKNKGKNE